MRGGGGLAAQVLQQFAGRAGVSLRGLGGLLRPAELGSCHHLHGLGDLAGAFHTLDAPFNNLQASHGLFLALYVGCGHFFGNVEYRLDGLCLGLGTLVQGVHYV